jgi:hypothetical protein
VCSKDAINLAEYFLPRPPHTTVQADWMDLSQPQPDIVIRYVTRRKAQSMDPPCASAFTAEEERLLDG